MGGVRRRRVAGASCVAVTALAGVLAGCASVATSSGVATSARGSCAAETLTITTVNNGKTLCATPGTAITVILRAPSDNKWQQVKSSSTVLTRQANPGTKVGVTEAVFVAAHPGKAVLSSDRSACHSSLGAQCGAIIAFHTTIVVQGS